MTTSKQRERIRMADPELGESEQSSVHSVLASGQLASGEEVTKFESEFSSYCDSTHGIATSNGTTALHTALEALGIGDGDTVVTTPFTFIATANAIRFAGAEPVFADIDPESFNLDPEAVEETIQGRDGRVDAILCVHLYGLPAKMDALVDIADRYDIPLIEDAAQAHGATHRNKPVGSFGDAACFSFYPTKNMTTGEGGMVVTDSERVDRRARQFIDHGRTEGYEHARVGHNFRMTDIAAAIGRVQLERLPKLLETRRANAEQLHEGLSHFSLTPPAVPEHVEHAYNQFTVRTPERDALQNMLDTFGIDTSIYYPRAVHQQPAYEETTTTAPHAEEATSEVLSLPVHPGLDDFDIEQMLKAIRYAEEDSK